MTYFYKDANGLYHIGKDILPSSKFNLIIHDNSNIISLEAADTNKLTFGPIEVVQLKRANETTYADLDTFLFEVGNFFL